MTLTKDRLVETVSNQCGLSKTRSGQLLDSSIEIIKETLERGEDVLISGFGKFCVKSKHMRRGRNPHTGEDLMLGARRVITFRCSPVMKDRINGQGYG